MPRKRSCFSADSFIQIAVTANSINVIIKKIKARLVVAGCQKFLTYCKADTIRKTLP
jgi:hypothetical protein